jgi:serine/threonine-protein kinase
MPEESPPVALGDVVAGKYRIDHVLGSGGMGIVVAARHLELDQPVAIKFLLPSATKNADVVQRFSREARAAVKIQSEHVARVLDVGVLEAGVPYMVMEYLEGFDLAHRLAQERRLPLPEITRYLLQACEALAEAHAAGVVHRDLKPANLFLATRADRTSIVKLLDFGISKAAVGSAGITSTQAVMGSPVYMSPEQLVSAKHVDHRSDIWSLGVVLYEALAGAPPFNAESMPQIVTRILHTPAPRLAESRPDLPPALDAIVARCLEKDPSSRFRDVAELTYALAPFTPDGARSVDRVARVLGQMHAAPVSSQYPPPAETRAEPEAWGGTQMRVRRRSALPWIVAAVLGVCVVLGIAAFVVRQRSQRAAALRAVASSVASAAPAASPPDPPVVTLTPPPDPAAAPPAASGSVAVATSATASPRPWGPGNRGKAPPPQPPTVASAAPGPPPAPAPAPTPTDPLHMGFK